MLKIVTDKLLIFSLTTTFSILYFRLKSFFVSLLYDIRKVDINMFAIFYIHIVFIYYLNYLVYSACRRIVNLRSTSTGYQQMYRTVTLRKYSEHMDPLLMSSSNQRIHSHSLLLLSPRWMKLRMLYRE